jgi:hypothetical protein
MRKIVIITLALVVALGALPVTFACYNWGWNNWGWGWCWEPEKPVYCCTTNCQLCFTSVNAYDNEATFTEPKDVGNTTACIKCCDKLKVTIENAYPGYEGIVDLCIKNTGNMAAQITGISTDYPSLLQIDLTGEVQEGTVIQPCQTKCGQLVIGGLPQENTQNLCLTFEITINYQCTCVPKNCDTAYAYYKCGCCGSLATCFSNWGFSQWGWTNGPLGPGSYTFDIYAGAGGCNPLKGKKVGWLTVDYTNSRRNGSTVTVTYYMYSGYKMDETHLYVGNEPLPRKNGSYTVAPGQYPYSHDLNNASTDQYQLTGLSGNIYVIAHAVVCW